MDFLKRKIYTPLVNLIRGGLTPTELSWSLAFGITGGLFPIPGVTSIICFVFIYFFSLNLIATQVANFCMTPFDIALVIPFIRAGDYFLGESLTFSVSEFKDQLQSDFFGSLSQFRVAIFHGIFAWGIFATLATPLLKFLLFPLVQKLEQQVHSRLD
jgi:uncharacterized protein (DUF2062 family)